MTEATTKAGEERERCSMYSGEVAFWIMRLEGT